MIVKILRIVNSIIKVVSECINLAILMLKLTLEISMEKYVNDVTPGVLILSCIRKYRVASNK
jgi:hypothetical protein